MPCTGGNWSVPWMALLVLFGQYTLLRIYLLKATAAAACFGGAHVCTACACICVINANENVERAN